MLMVCLAKGSNHMPPMACTCLRKLRGSFWQVFPQIRVISVLAFLTRWFKPFAIDENPGDLSGGTVVDAAFLAAKHAVVQWKRPN